MNNIYRNFICCFFVLVLISACKTVPDEYGYGDPVKQLTEKEQMLMSARNAALERQYTNIRRGELSGAEKLYRSAPKNSKAAFGYAHLLRKVDQVGQAEMILKPFAIDPQKANEDILLEYAKIQLKKGDFEAAQIYAQESMMRVDTAQARMVLGVAVDAQGHHQAAENHFKSALDKAHLDIDLQNSIKNNLALSLMAQGKESEAQSLLSSIRDGSDSLNMGVVSGNKRLLGKL